MLLDSAASLTDWADCYTDLELGGLVNLRHFKNCDRAVCIDLNNFVD